MRKVLKIIGNVLLLILLPVILFFAIMSIYHHAMLLKEKKDIAVAKTMVEVDGYNMHVFIDGPDKEEEKSAIVLLSGSGVAAPVFDYKILYSKLTDEYQVVVVEKSGYGYSDVSGLPRDVKTMVDEVRKALKSAGESGPYILMPHSMSALEAIYWSKSYPDEVKAIIGLDMAVPESYNEDSNNLSSLLFNKIMTNYFGMHRIPLFCYINKDGLSEQEIEQHKYLTYRNTLNDDVFAECKMVYENAKTVKKLGAPDVPVLMFTTDLGNPDGSESWIKAQDDFARQSDKYVQIKLHCGHNLHYYESEYIVNKIKEFMAGLQIVK